MTSLIWIYLLFPGIPLLVLFCLGKRIQKEREAADRPFSSMRRPAGYSLQERADDQWSKFSGELAFTVFVACVPGMLFVASEGKSFWTWTLFGAIASPIYIYRLWKSYRPLPNYWLGLRGEQAVGGVLDALHGDHVVVFHDLEIKENGIT
jgi:hypothetical protein